jgi:hypothetical protein
MPTQWQIAVAAEALAAAQFARCGFDVSVQYGANQPEYDLIVAKGERLLKVSVKGSHDSSWGLAQSYLQTLGNALGHSHRCCWNNRTIPESWGFPEKRVHDLLNGVLPAWRLLR